MYFVLTRRSECEVLNVKQDRWNMLPKTVTQAAKGQQNI